MSNKLISMSKVRNIIKLYTEGVSKQSIGERTDAVLAQQKNFYQEEVVL